MVVQWHVLRRTLVTFGYGWPALDIALILLMPLCQRVGSYIGDRESGNCRLFNCPRRGVLLRKVSNPVCGLGYAAPLGFAIIFALTFFPQKYST